MTNVTAPAAESPVRVHARAALSTRAAVLPRAMWQKSALPNGTPTFSAMRGGPVPKGTWFAWIMKRSGGSVVLPLIACPKCGGLVWLMTDKSTEVYRLAFGKPDLPVVHRVESNGKVTPDVQCMKPGCGFHRTVYLDRWNKTKALWAIAYVVLEKNQIKIDYTHAVNRKEAIFMFGVRKGVKIIDAGPAVGFYVDEKTGRMKADATVA